MFPETLDDEASYVSTQYEHGEPTCVQQPISAFERCYHYAHSLSGTLPKVIIFNYINFVITFHIIISDKIVKISQYRVRDFFDQVDPWASVIYKIFWPFRRIMN